jgi:NTE family protein
VSYWSRGYTLSPEPKKKIGLALSGGAARGFSHVGVLKVFAEHNIPIDMIAGTSAGSVVAGAFAAGMTPHEIIEMGRNIKWMKISRPPFSLMGLLSNAPLGRFVAKNFPVKRIEDMPIRFAAVACDIETGQEVVYKDSGDLGEAIRASCAIPGVFTPVETADGRMLVDGGVVAPVPVKALRKMGADIIIAVDVLASGSSKWGKPTTMIGVMLQSAMMLLRTAAKLQNYRAEIAIIPEVAHFRIDDLSKIDELIAAGEAAAREKIDEIKALIGE